jgi:hypothetical protein
VWSRKHLSWQKASSLRLPDWGFSYASAKDFKVDRITLPDQAGFDSVRAK